jgi:hypothetical protein
LRPLLPKRLLLKHLLPKWLLRLMLLLRPLKWLLRLMLLRPLTLLLSTPLNRLPTLPLRRLLPSNSGFRNEKTGLRAGFFFVRILCNEVGFI